MRSFVELVFVGGIFLWLQKVALGQQNCFRRSSPSNSHERRFGDCRPRQFLSDARAPCLTEFVIEEELMKKSCCGVCLLGPGASYRRRSDYLSCSQARHRPWTRIRALSPRSPGRSGHNTPGRTRRCTRETPKTCFAKMTHRDYKCIVLVLLCRHPKKDATTACCSKTRGRVGHRGIRNPPAPAFVGERPACGTAQTVKTVCHSPKTSP